MDDIEAVYRRLSENGARIINPPAVIAPGRVACYLADPDGNWVELMELSE